MDKKRCFCSVPNWVAQDRNLSLKAKGLYLLIQSCMDDPEFNYYRFKQAVQAYCEEGDKAFDSTWKELKNAGYLKQRRISHGSGPGFHYAYKLLNNGNKGT